MINAAHALLFDLDGTLVDSEVLAERAVSLAFAEVDHVITPEEVGTRFGGFTDVDLVRTLSEETGRDFGERRVQRISEIVADLQRAELQPIEGIAALLERLLGVSSVRMAVVSNSNMERIHRSLALTGLESFFAQDDRFSSEQVPQGKPAPDIYAFAAERIGVPPHLCIAVEDSVTGATAAQAAGIPTLGIVAGGHAKDIPARLETLQGLNLAGVAEGVTQLEALIFGE